MTDMKDLLDEVERLPPAQKWQLVRHVLRSLEHEQSASAAQLGWRDFLHATYGSLRDNPIQRWEQGEYEEREPLE